LYGSQVIRERIALTSRLCRLARDVYGEISGGEKVNFKYLSTVKFSGSESEDEIRECFSRQLKESLEEEVSRARTLSGPHRDDLLIVVAGRDARVYSSRGQQRSVVLSLKVSLLKMWKEEVGEYPLLLMDDVFSELDEKRRHFLLQIVISGGVQSFITTTEAQVLFASMVREAKFFLVSGGVIYEGGAS